MKLPAGIFPVGPVFVAVIAISVTTVALSLPGLMTKKKLKIIRSPRVTLLPKLSTAEITALPYPPDFLPGGRDVDSPYGVLRVYEWGPEDGRKVLLVHGITTSCVALGAVAQALVEKGCRVMTFDLWGRGYSDSPDLPHDERLYMTQILLAVTSSPLCWTGGSHGGFSVVGYSLGGCLSASFTSHFPEMVKSLVLICPTGVIRRKHLGRQRRLLFLVNFIPEWVLEIYVKRTLQKPIFPHENKEPDAGDVAQAEIKGEPNTIPAVRLVSEKYPEVTVMGAVQWHLQENAGFVRSFISTVKYSPITGQEVEWKKIGSRKDKTLVFAGTHDPIIVAEELHEDAEALLGKDKLEWRLIDGAHDIPVTEADQLVDEICRFWGM